jgi:hypothetical protein
MLGSYCNTRTAAKQLNENCSCWAAPITNAESFLPSHTS